MCAGLPAGSGDRARCGHTHPDTCLSASCPPGWVVHPITLTPRGPCSPAPSRDSFPALRPRVSGLLGPRTRPRPHEEQRTAAGRVHGAASVWQNPVRTQPEPSQNQVRTPSPRTQSELSQNPVRTSSHRT